MGEEWGGLLNATFGNAAELIIALAALRAAFSDVVKASIAGWMVGNMLLVLGAAMLAGGLRRSEQHSTHLAFPEPRCSCLRRSVWSYLQLFRPRRVRLNRGSASSVSISVVLFVVYSLFLVFVLVTRSALFAGPRQEEEGERKGQLAGLRLCLLQRPQQLPGSARSWSGQLGLPHTSSVSAMYLWELFVVAILGNAAEHATAVQCGNEGPHGPYRFRSRSGRVCKSHFLSRRFWSLRAFFSVLHRWT